MKYRVMVVEDQREIRSIVEKYLLKEGYDVTSACDGFEALAAFNNSTVHLVLLDIMMPGIDGFEVLSEIRKVSEIPVIMLTARQSEVDRVKGFRAGVDDYVVKPFSASELMLRVRRLLQRVYRETDEIVYRHDDLTLHTGSRKLYRGDEEIELTTTEYQLLHVLFRNPGKVFSREQIIE